MAGIQGSDESFVAFAFAIVTLIMMFLYFPVLIGCVKELVQAFTGTSHVARRKRDDDADDAADQSIEGPKPNWRILLDDFTELPRVALNALRHPQHLTRGLHLVRNQRGLVKVFANDALRFCVRPRFIFLVLWVLLLSSAMYASITFDPHAILGIEKSATDKDVKRAYRKLTKINHPDHNKTEAARVIYAQVRRAYKALVDRDAFDKDVDTEEMTFGISLPSWMMNHEHDGKILFGLLAILIGVPAYIWKRFRGNTMDSFREKLQAIQTNELLLEPLYLELGIPLDPKFIERRRERRELAEILVKLGVLPVVDEGAVDHFPAVADFKRMCLDPMRNANALQRLGLPPPLFETFKTFFESYEPEEKLKVPEGNFTKADPVTYETLVYVIDKTQTKVRRECKELTSKVEMLTQMQGIEFRTVKKLERLHKDFLDTLADVYKQEKPNARDVRALIETPQKRLECVRDLPREINALFQSMQQQAQMRQQQAVNAQRRR